MRTLRMASIIYVWETSSCWGVSREKHGRGLVGVMWGGWFVVGVGLRWFDIGGGRVRLLHLCRRGGVQ